MCDALRRLKRLASRQADDNGLWFEAKYASEAYVQRELRILHAAVEKATCNCEAQNETRA